MDWKEEMVLQFRKLTIDKNIISEAMNNFVKVFNENIDKYNIENIEATTDSYNFIEIKNYKKIEIKYHNNDVLFIIYDKYAFEQDVYIRLSVIKELGYYLIEYVNTDKRNSQMEAFIDKSTIDEIFQDLFELNREVIKISRE